MSTATDSVRALERRFVFCTRQTIDAFEARVDRSGECWIWTGDVNPVNGYGQFSVRRRTYRAHRLAWQLWRGPIPDGLFLDHLCRVRRCVNPAHLEPVTHDENMRRSAWATKTHCIHGHPFDEENTLYRRPNKRGRTCRRCAAERSRRYNERKARQ